MLHEEQQTISTRRDVRVYTVLATTQLLRNWREQRPRNQRDLDCSVKGEVGTVYCIGLLLTLI
jgi:hypothetical protein